MTQYVAQAMDADTFLEHYGVKGMRWGHRKAQRLIDTDRFRQQIIDVNR